MSWLSRLGLMLLWGLVASCASAPASLREEGEETASSWQEACEDPRGLVFLCGEEACAFYRCRDVAPGRVVRAFSTAPVVRPILPAPGSSAQRNWGSAMGLPANAEPVFIIPWYDDKPQRSPPIFTQEQLRELERARGKPTEKHHIFPQQLKAWFKDKGINIHAWTLVLLKEDHDRIHRGPEGGPWNEAWRQYKRQNEGASPEAIWLYAGELIHRFELYGPVIPYYRRKPPSPPITAY
jgi:uncharacterized lipoprotein (TIGR02269 family)